MSYYASLLDQLQEGTEFTFNSGGAPVKRKIMKDVDESYYVVDLDGDIMFPTYSVKFYTIA